jgi:hypothetical protein
VANPTYPAQPAASPRPTTVTVAGYLLYAVAALIVVTAVLTAVPLGTMSRVIEESATPEMPAEVGTFIVGFMIALIVVEVLVAAGFVLLAVFNNKGKNGSRITTWIIGGIAACCCGLSATGGAFSSVGNMSGSPDAANDEMTRRLEAEMPGWVNAASTGVSILLVLAVIGAIVLLAMPASNAYFRGAPTNWEPQMPGYPGYPGTPQGYPGAPQGYPGAPQGYPGAPQGYPGAPQGYPGAPQGYPGAPQGYPGAPQGYPGAPGQPPPGYPQPGDQQYPPAGQGTTPPAVDPYAPPTTPDTTWSQPPAGPSGDTTWSAPPPSAPSSPAPPSSAPPASGPPSPPPYDPNRPDDQNRPPEEPTAPPRPPA